ncbi:interferon-inducible GTPase-domain-containing protein [Syncephalastrum racemosum]|uniref:Interferon-inducible GTPase-domain-containing protein n=1 Tax=Syncephalastrum racemosum TaxID=13706 RepID=A0A1X2HJE3_SYNRA|nr:interferon-inducible GTPase-domain-containing protein [Syncephalastrum racemosum]
MGVSPSSRTADDLWILESAQRGAQAVGVTLLSPFVVIACPIVGAYEFGSAMDDELMTGSQILDGTIGFLLGVVASPLAPFYVFWESMEALFRSQPPPLPPPRFLPASLLGQKRQWTLDDLEAVRLRMAEFDCQQYYNVALVGCKGTGKSTLLNGLLGYKDSHVRAAPVGEASATKEPRGYRHPVLQSLMLWDLPGAEENEKRYFERYGLGYFDALVIVSTDRLMATDVKLARKALEYRVPIFFVRNKADAVRTTTTGSIYLSLSVCMYVSTDLIPNAAPKRKGHPVQDAENEEEAREESSWRRASGRHPRVHGQ